MADQIRVSDAATLRAISHPMRQRILLELGVLDHARAADLAEVIGRPANAISFHLRTLARAGLIVEAPEHARDKRDRVWKRVADGYTVDAGLPGLDAAIAPYLAWLRDLLAHSDDPRYTQEARTEVNLRDGLLTTDEAEQLIDEIVGVIERWHQHSLTTGRRDPQSADRRYYQVLFALGPADLVETDQDPGTAGDPQ